MSEKLQMPCRFCANSTSRSRGKPQPGPNLRASTPRPKHKDILWSEHVTDSHATVLPSRLFFSVGAMTLSSLLLLLLLCCCFCSCLLKNTRARPSGWLPFMPSLIWHLVCDGGCDGENCSAFRRLLTGRLHLLLLMCCAPVIQA